MSTDPLASKDNTYAFDPEEPAEMARLIALDRFTTRAMGGPLAGLPELPTDAQVLDLACGPGGWVLDTAFERRDIEVAGVDISQHMIAYANARALSQGLSNVSFGLMNILEPLDFSDNSFDLVNGRLLVAVLHRDAWPGVLQECVRILKPGGILRITDTDFFALTNSPAAERICEISYQATRMLNYGFSPNGRTFGMTPMLSYLLRKAGCQNIQSRAHVIDFSAGTDAWADFYHNFEVMYTLGKSISVNLGLTTQEEMESLHAQWLNEMNREDFCGVWYFLSVWGTKP
jgi:ubiquinone/menaquinone biosynthesis C-methylase UbiE